MKPRGTRGRRRIILNKGGEKYIFCYQEGREDELLDAVVDAAKDPRTDFDWFDAAVISYGLTGTLIGTAEELLRSEI